MPKMSNSVPKATDSGFSLAGYSIGDFVLDAAFVCGRPTGAHSGMPAGATAGSIDYSLSRISNKPMRVERQQKADAELAGILDQPGTWMVKAEAATAVPEPSLHDALFQAFKMASDGLRVTHIVQLPDNTVVLDVTQIHRLWWRVGLLGN